MIRDMGDKIKDLLISTVMAALAGLGTLFPLPTPFVLHFVVLFSFLFHGQLLGKKLFPKTPTIPSVFIGSLIFLAIFSLFQTGWFYLGWPLTAVSDAWCLLLAIGGCQAVCFLFRDPATEPDDTPPTPPGQTSAAFGLVLVAISLCLSILWPAWKAGTFLSIRSPWPLLPTASLLAIACLWILGIYARIRTYASWAIALLDSIALAATTSITLFIYRLGFGFDGFLHIASEQVLLQTGFLQPKPFYYIGQYVLTTWFSRFADIPIASVDAFLVPLACALLLPFGVFILQRYRPFAGGILFALFPVAVGIATTPQSFAYIIGILALILSLGSGPGRIHPLAPILLGLWSIAIHPLAGIPLFLASFALWACSFRFFSLLAAALSGLAVPCVFFLLSYFQGNSAHWDFSRIFAAAPWVDAWHALVPTTNNFFLVFVAWASLAANALCLSLLLISLWSFRRLPKEERWPVGLLGLACISLLISFVILKSAGDFTFLIDYERGNYADRLLLLSTVMAFFAAVPGLRQKLQDLRQASPWVTLVFLVGFGACGAALSYQALPRHDALTVGRGWSVGKADIEAVRFIERDAAGTPYGVLANQSVSAAAVSQFGFKRYAKQDVFYYPIPTGGPLYEQYLRLTYRETTLDPIADAAKLTEASRMYVVINDYWWQADQLAEVLGGLTSAHWTFGETSPGMGSRVDVYRFDLNTASADPTATSTR